MYTYIAVLLGLHLVSAAPPIKLTIDCGSHETDGSPRLKSAAFSNRIDINSLCSIIHKALPKSVNDGKFILIGDPMDQSEASNDLAPIAIPPPRGFTLKGPRIKVPNFQVPKLKYPRFKSTRSHFAPRVGAPMHFSSLRARIREEESSAERMEKFKKGLQKMLHVVKVLGQIDQYLSERARSIVDVISKTIKEPNDSPKHYY